MSLSFQAHEHERTRLGCRPSSGWGCAGRPRRRLAYDPSAATAGRHGWVRQAEPATCRRRMRVACRRRQIEVRVTTANAGQAGTLVTAAKAEMPIAWSV
jgi:hypothetical protein